MVTARTATARENMRPAPVPAPAPAVIRPLVRPRDGFGPATAAGLLAAGTLTGLALRRRR
jgi:membrane protein